MVKTWIVARHEFSVTLGRVGYRISLAVVPVVALLAFIGIFIFQSVRSGEVSVEAAAAESVKVGYVDLSEGEDGGRIFSSFQRQGRTTFVPYADQETATGALLEGDIDDLYIFDPDYLRSGRVTRVEIKRSGINMDGNSSAGSLRRFVVSNLLEGRVEAELAARVAEPYRLTTVEVDEAGTEAGESGLNFSRLVIFGAFGLLLTVSLFTAGGYLVQSVTEEKQNRVMEVLISSIKPDQLMFGKLLGLGAVGLLLVVVWAASGLLFLLIVGRVVDLPVLDFTFSLGALILALTYFLLGYAFIGTLMAAIGGVTTSQQEANNITAFVVLPAVSPIWFTNFLIQDPEGVVARILSFVPITAPVASMIRLAFGGMGAIDVTVSLLLLLTGVTAVVWLATRLFRAYLLMYGQRPRIVDMVRTLWGR